MSLIFPKKEILYAPMLGTLGGGSARGFGRGIGGGGFEGPIGWFTPTNTTGTTANRTTSSTNLMTYIRSRTNDFQVLNFTGQDTKATAYDPITHDLWAFDNSSELVNWEYDADTDQFLTGYQLSVNPPTANSAYNHASVWAINGYFGYVRNDGWCNIFKKTGSGSSVGATYLGQLNGFATSEESLSQVGYFIAMNGYQSGVIGRLKPDTDYSIVNSTSLSSQSGGDGSTHMDFVSSDRLMYAGHNATDQIKMARWDGSSVSYSVAAAGNTHFGNDWHDNHMANKVALFNHSQTANSNYNAGDLYSSYYGWLGCRGNDEIVDKGYGLNGNWQSRSAAATHGLQTLYCPYHEQWRILTTNNTANASATNKIEEVYESNSTIKTLELRNAVTLSSSRTIYTDNRGTCSTAGNYHPTSGGIVGA